MSFGQTAANKERVYHMVEHYEHVYAEMEPGKSRSKW